MSICDRIFILHSGIGIHILFCQRQRIQGNVNTNIIMATAFSMGKATRRNKIQANTMRQYTERTPDYGSITYKSWQPKYGWYHKIVRICKSNTENKSIYRRWYHEKAIDKDYKFQDGLINFVQTEWKAIKFYE